MKTVIFAEKSGAPSYAGNRHVAIMEREDDQYFYVRNTVSDTQLSNYPKYAWKIEQSRESNLADFVGWVANGLSRDKFVYCSYPFSCGLTEALAHMKQFVFPINAKIDRKPGEAKITLDPLKGSGKRKKLVIKLWTA